MPDNRFFLQAPIFEKNQLLFLEKEEFHHLSHVMRLKAGETIELINGLGYLAEASIVSLEKHRASLSITSVYTENPPSYRLVLAQAFPRIPRLEYIIEKSVELGVTELWLFPGILSEKKEISPSGLERLHHIAFSAVKQCGRLFMPKILILPPLQKWKHQDIPSHAFFGDTRHSRAPFPSSLSSNSFLIVIGPEKGLHEKEVLHLETHLHMQGIALHKNILRTDTAAICALSLASFFLS
jgi:16S rRNA (uracil1498-N3)-methyltransferase